MHLDIDVIVFDPGGVLIELGAFPVKQSWLTGRTLDNHEKSTWLESDIAQAFETGKISALEFATTFIHDRNLKVTTEEFLSHFRQWPVGPFPGVHAILDTLRKNHALAIFSNTNELHGDRLLQEMGLQGRFDHYFASHLIGRAKPAIESYRFIAAEMEKSPDRILFLDDNSVSVTAARQAGFIAEQVTGFNAATGYLTSRGLL